MNAATLAYTQPEAPSAFRAFLTVLGAKLRRAIELSAAPYMVMGSRYL